MDSTYRGCVVKPESSAAKEFKEKVKMKAISESGSSLSPTSPIPVSMMWTEQKSVPKQTTNSSAVEDNKNLQSSLETKHLVAYASVVDAKSSLIGKGGTPGINLDPVALENNLGSKDKEDKDEVFLKIPDIEFIWEMHDMTLTEYHTWGKFFLKKSTDSNKNVEIDAKMNEYYDSGRGNTVPVQELKQGCYYVAYIYNKSKWCRIRVTKCVETHLSKVRVVLIDEGVSTSICPREIRTLDAEFSKHPRRATQCYLSSMENIKEAAGKQFNKNMKLLKGQNFTILTEGITEGILKIDYIQLEKLTSVVGVDSVLRYGL